jgi:RNA polymerase sigma factor (sigma-70 family)
VAINGKQQPAVMRQIRTLLGAGTVGGLTDGELLDRFLARGGELSELAFAALLERHGGMVWGICRRVLADPYDAQDAFQATFLVLVRRAGSIRNRDSVASWLHGVAYRVACSARAAALRRRRHERSYAEQAGRFVAHPREEHDDLKEVLDQELGRLPEPYRAAIVLCDLEGLTYEQAAQSLGWPMGTVKSRLARGRDALRSRLIRRGAAPSAGLIGVLSIVDDAGAEVPSVLAQATVRAALRFSTHRVTASSISPGVLKLAEGAITTMLLTKLKLSFVALAIGAGLVSLTAFLASPGLGAGAQERRQARGIMTKDGEPVTKPDSPGTMPPPTPVQAAPSGWANPAPWETAVRVRTVLARNPKSIVFGSGTIIHSTPEESLILTCAHIFRPDGKLEAPPSPPTNDYSRNVKVDLFDGKVNVHGDKPAQIHFLESLVGETLDFDFALDVGLIRIRPGRKLPASRVVPYHWNPQAGMKMLAVGCSEGQGPTAWDTKIVNPRVRLANSSYEGIECTVAPKQGRTGGGLFTTDGYLAGVCNFAEPRANYGLYAESHSIHNLLDRAHLAFLYEDEPARPAAADFGELITRTDEKQDRQESPSPPVDDLKARLPSPPVDDLKARLDESVHVNDRLRKELQDLRAELQALRAAKQTGAGIRASSRSQPRDQSAPGPHSPADIKRIEIVAESAVPDDATPRGRASATSPSRSQPQSSYRYWGLIFAASPTGNRVIAYDPVRHSTYAIELHATKEHPLKVTFVINNSIGGLLGLRLEGEEITRIAAFDLKSRTWHPQDLSEPVKGRAVPNVDMTVSYDLGGHLYTFNSKDLTWDHLDVSAIPDTTGSENKGKAAASN